MSSQSTSASGNEEVLVSCSAEPSEELLFYFWHEGQTQNPKPCSLAAALESFDKWFEANKQSAKRVCLMKKEMEEWADPDLSLPVARYMETVTAKVEPWEDEEQEPQQCRRLEPLQPQKSRAWSSSRKQSPILSPKRVQSAPALTKSAKGTGD